VLEGTYEEVMHVFHAVNEHLVRNGCNEWILNFQIQLRSGSPITAGEKVEKFRNS
jgi:uncharacterized protein YqgV (UPF0045/DUF77 family)